MGTLEKNDQLNSSVAASISQHMEHLLRDVFRLMFNLNLAVAPSSSLDPQDSVAANLVLRHEKVDVCISFRISRSTAHLIAERVGMGTTGDLPKAVQQDVACEIVNIVGNNLRTALSQDLGVHFDFDVAKVVVDKIDCTMNSPIQCNMDFQITPETPVSVGFICGTK